MVREEKDTRPPPPEWLNKDFVQNALRAEKVDETINVVSSEARMANAVGDGYASDMYRITAQLGDGTIRSLIVKCHPQGGRREDMVKKWDAFTIELNMPTKTLPAMADLLEKANPGKYPPLAAKCLYHGEVPVKFLVLEDLRELDFILAKRQQGLDMPSCSLVMKNLARYHAASVALHAQNPMAVEHYSQTVHWEAIREHMEGFIKGAFKSVANEVETWPIYRDRYADKLHKLADLAYDHLVDVFRRKEGGYNVLIHGDLWTSNMMFKYTDGAVADMRLVDFQTTHYSSPAIDLHYFLSTCPNEEVRTHHVDQLLQEYRCVLNHTLEELGCSEHQILPEVLMRELDDGAFFGVFTSFMILPVVMSDPKDGFDFEKSLEGNYENFDSTKLIYSGAAYKRALNKLLPLYESKSII